MIDKMGYVKGGGSLANFQNLSKIVHFLPVFGCIGDSAWNYTPTVYSVFMGLYFFSNQDFSANGVVKGVWGAESFDTGNKF